MMKLQGKRIGMIGCLSTIVFSITIANQSAQGSVNLELRLESVVPLIIGDSINVGLYAVSDNGFEGFAGMKVIIEWDSNVLLLQGFDSSGGPAMFSEGFLPDLAGLNEANPPIDGDGIYGRNSVPLEFASPEGQWVTTFQFEIIGVPAQSGLTHVGIMPTAGVIPAFEWTVVWDDEVAGLQVTGTMVGTDVEIQPTPTCTGDTNGDAVINVVDLLDVLATWGDSPSPNDFDASGTVDVGDLLALISAWGPCPLPAASFTNPADRSPDSFATAETNSPRK